MNRRSFDFDKRYNNNRSDLEKTTKRNKIISHILLFLLGVWLILLPITGVIGHPRVNINDNHIVASSDGRTMQIINNSPHWHVCTIGVYQFEVPPGRYDQWGNWRPGLSRVYPANTWNCY